MPSLRNPQPRLLVKVALVVGTLVAAIGILELIYFEISDPERFADLVHGRGFDLESKSEWSDQMRGTLFPIWRRIDFGLSILIAVAGAFAYFRRVNGQKETSEIKSPSRLNLVALGALAAILICVTSFIDNLLSLFIRQTVPWWADSLGFLILQFPTNLIAMVIFFCPIALSLSLFGRRPETIFPIANPSAAAWKKLLPVLAAAPFVCFGTLIVCTSGFPNAILFPIFVHIGLAHRAYAIRGWKEELVQ